MDNEIGFGCVSVPFHPGMFHGDMQKCVLNRELKNLKLFDKQTNTMEKQKRNKSARKVVHLHTHQSLYSAAWRCACTG